MKNEPGERFRGRVQFWQVTRWGWQFYIRNDELLKSKLEPKSLCVRFIDKGGLNQIIWLKQQETLVDIHYRS